MGTSECICSCNCIEKTISPNKVVSAFKSSINAFDNIFGNMFTRINTVLLKIQNFAFKPEVCKMGGNYWLQNGLNLLCRVWPSGQRPERRMLRSRLDALYEFQNLQSVHHTEKKSQICSQCTILKNTQFEKIIKILFLQKCQLFECFSVWCTYM